MIGTASTTSGEHIIGKACVFATIVMMLLSFPGFAADKQKDEDTLRQANLVLQGLIDSKSIPPRLVVEG